MVNVLTSSVVDHGFIGGVMVNWLPSSVVDHVLIGGVMVSWLPSSVVDHGIVGGVLVSLSETKDYRIGINCFSFTGAHSIMQ